MALSVVYILPASSLHGGVRVILEHAEGLAERGYQVRVVGPEPPPDWHPLSVPYEQRPVFEPGGVPRADIVIGTFWTTLKPAMDSGSQWAFHLCQGWEGVHREYAPILDQIDAAYRLPLPKLLISAHLVPVIRERYGVQPHLLGQAIDAQLFHPGPFREVPTGLQAHPLTVGVVGPYGLRPKAIGEALEGFRRARDAGLALEVHHASADPMSEEERSLRIVDHFHHRLSTREMVGFYQGLDALVHPSHDEEGFPLPPLEAMACGVPAVLTRIGSFRVLPDEAVLRFDPGAPETLVPELRRLRDPGERRRLRERGLEVVREYTLDRLLDRLESAFAAEGVPVRGHAAAHGAAPEVAAPA